MLIKKGDNLELTCGVKGATQPSQIMWYFYAQKKLTEFTNHLQLKNSQYEAQNVVTNSADTLTLNVDNVDQSAAGLYGCREVQADAKLKYLLLDVVVLGRAHFLFSSKFTKKIE